MILNMAMVQYATPDDMLARVFSVRMMVLGLIPLGTTIAGAGAEVTSPQTAVAVMGVVASILMLVCLLWYRRLETSGQAMLTRTTEQERPPILNDT